MASVKQLAANRTNAKKSTGPRTESGKARSRLNSWKHGLTAAEIAVGNEDPSKFDTLRADLWDQFQPEVGLESVLLDRLAGYAWRLSRVPVLEARCFYGKLRFDFTSAGLLQPLSRYETALLNAFNRTLQQLLVLQDRRRSEEEHNRTIEALPAPGDQDAA